MTYSCTRINLQMTCKVVKLNCRLCIPLNLNRRDAEFRPVLLFSDDRIDCARKLGAIFSSKCSIAIDDISRSSCSNSWALGGFGLTRTDFRMRYISSRTYIKIVNIIGYVQLRLRTRYSVVFGVGKTVRPVTAGKWPGTSFETLYLYLGTHLATWLSIK